MTTDNKHLIEKIKKLEKENASLKQKQIEITEAKELYLKIFEEFPALIWRARLDKLCDYFNKTWLEFTGRSMEQEFGNGWTESLHPNDFDACLNTYVKCFDKREAFVMVYRMKNRFGEYRWIRDYGSPFYDLDNSFLGYIGSCYDITDIKENEIKLQELNSNKNKFFSIIGHDLKGPFNAIIGFSELLVEFVKEKDFEKVGEIAEVMLQSSRRAMSLLSNLIKWSQTQSGTIEYNPEHFNLLKMVNEVVQLLEGVASQKSITINNLVDPKSTTFADKEMIQTVIRNLISNALKYTHAGGKVEVSSSFSNEFLTVKISDNGVGIPAEKVNNLFNIAERHSTPGTQNEKGTGLGLLLCKEFIEKHSGKLEVASEVGFGSTFSFTLPIGENQDKIISPLEPQHTSAKDEI